MRIGGSVQLQHWTPDQMAARLPDVMTVYRRAFLDLHERDPARAEAERTAHARTHVHRAGLRVVVALASDPDLPGGTDEGALVGMAYGQPGARGQWWHDTVVSSVPPDVAQQWLSDVFEIVELHVLPEWQGSGLGRQLLRALLDGCGRRTAALSALELPDSPARHLYASEGFLPLLSDFHFAGGDTAYAVLVKQLA